VFRFIPRAVEVRTGAVGYAEQSSATPRRSSRMYRAVRPRGAGGSVAESLIDVAMGLMAPPAMFAVIVEALTDAGIRHGMPHDTAAELVVAAMAGTALLGPDNTLGLPVGDVANGATARGLGPGPAGVTPRCRTRWTPCSGAPAMTLLAVTRGHRELRRRGPRLC
jgi:hypothetical protein